MPTEFKMGDQVSWSIAPYRRYVFVEYGSSKTFATIKYVDYDEGFPYPFLVFTEKLALIESKPIVYDDEEEACFQ